MRLHVKNILLQCPSGSENACDFILQDIEHDATGGGAFAFVSGEGAALFLNSLKFKKFMDNGGCYQLIVGTDSVTNSYTLTVIKNALKKYKTLTVLFHVSTGNTIFHPKFSWSLSRKNTGSIIIGSSNLTVNGLLNNWEAASITKIINKEDADSLNQAWKEWLNKLNEEGLYTIDSDIVQEAIKNNSFVSNKKERTPKNIKSIKDLSQGLKSNRDILILEIPQGRTGKNAYSQVNFGKKIFRDFFELTEKTSETFSFIAVLPNVDEKVEQIPEVEKRPPIFKPNSSNYNFELNLPKGHSPYIKKPIGLFYPISEKCYKYTFIAPDTNNAIYNVLASWLEKNIKEKGNENRRKIIPSDDFIEEIFAQAEHDEKIINDVGSFFDRFF